MIPILLSVDPSSCLAFVLFSCVFSLQANLCWKFLVLCLPRFTPLLLLHLLLLCLRHLSNRPFHQGILFLISFDFLSYIHPSFCYFNSDPSLSLLLLLLLAYRQKENKLKLLL
jgi:hypothetical protein